jgi:TolA-binding protein
MERTRKRKTLTALILLIILLVCPSSLIAAKPPKISVPDGSSLDRPVLITTTDSEYGTTVEILGAVKVPEFRTMAFESPPTITVDIFGAVRAFESLTIPLKSKNLKKIRLGYHPDKIRVVMDIRGDRIPPFSSEPGNNRLSLFLRSKELTVHNLQSKEAPKIPKTGIQNGNHETKKRSQSNGDDGKKETALVAASPSETWTGEGPPVLITATDSDYGTKVEILGSLNIPEFRTKTIESPPMISVDIFARVPSFEPVTIPLKSQNLKEVRLGHHLEKITVVLDIRGGRIPPFSTESVNNRLSLFLRSKGLAARPSSGQKASKILKTGIQSGREEAKKRHRSSGGDVSPPEKLIQVERDDGQEDTSLLLASIRAYQDQAWSSALDRLQHLLITYPNGRYTERAHFLMAKAYERLYSENILDYFSEVTNKYTKAIQMFPQSIHVPDALLSLGDLYYGIDNIYEASGYYKLVLRKETDSLQALKATMGIARILARRENRKEAVELLKKVIGKHPDSPENVEVRIEMAKILHEMNYFLKSLEILTNLKRTDPENEYRYPEISLYLGHNYYQLGENRRARENLLRYYNCCPEKEANHLILTKIGDTYRDEGALKEAVEFYNLVITLYPEREGAVISQIRLAELKEDGSLGEDGGPVSVVNILGKEQGSARAIYEKILSKSFEQDQKKSLEQLTLFKLAQLEQNEDDHNKSVETLKTLLRRFPNTALRKDSISTLKKSIQAIFDEEMKDERSAGIVQFYERERDLFSMVHDPDLFLIVARASIRLNLDDMATEMYKKADSLWPNKKRPPDMLLYLAEDLFEGEQLTSAMAKVDHLLKNYRSDPHVSNAYQLKGKILFKQKHMGKAVEMFSSAARFHTDPCKRAESFVYKGRALVGGGLPKKALIAIGEADRLRGDCDGSDTRLSREIGEILLSLGRSKEALSIFKQALSAEKNQEEIILIQLKIAECYWLLNKRADSFALYDKLAALDDPFWSNLAKERREDLNFKMEMETIK